MTRKLGMGIVATLCMLFAGAPAMAHEHGGYGRAGHFYGRSIARPYRSYGAYPAYPVYGAPVYGAPIYRAPIYRAPMYGVGRGGYFGSYGYRRPAARFGGRYHR